MSKPYSQPGEKGTGTNQASEDELEQHLLNDKAFQHILKFAPNSQRELMTFELARYINALIRTEKLKLLAEVRERVVGEDLPLNTTPDTGQRIYNKVKANERTALTELEAEL